MFSYIKIKTIYIYQTRQDEDRTAISPASSAMLKWKWDENVGRNIAVWFNKLRKKKMI